MEDPKGALGAIVRGLRASGMDARYEEDEIVATPKTEWIDGEYAASGVRIEELDYPGVKIVVRVGEESQSVFARDMDAKQRWWIETSAAHVFSVPAKPGARVSVHVEATCDKGSRDLVRGEVTIPDEIHNMGAPGVLVVPRALENCLVYLHLANVEGEQRIIALEASLGQ